MPTQITKGLIENDAVQLRHLEPAIRSLLANIQNPPTPSAGTATFTATPTINTKTVVIRFDVGDMNATGVYVTRDDATAPTLFSQFTPSSFTGQSDYSITVPDYSTDYAIRAWVWDSDAGAVVQATDGNGNTSITVHALDRLAPVWSGVTIALTANATNPNSQIDVDVTGTPRDSESGIAQYDLIDFETGDPVLLDVDISSTITVTVAPGTYTWNILATDNAGNSSYSDTSGVTIDPAASGSISFTSTSFTGSESSGKCVVTLQRTGGSTGAVSVTVSTVDDTAVAGTNYTAISSATISWADGDAADKTVDTDGVEITDTSATENNQFFMQIDYGSESGASVVAPVACRCIITGSGGVTAGYQQESSSPYRLVVDGENATTFTNATYTGRTSDALQIGGPDNNWAEKLAIVPNNTHSYGSNTTLDPTAPYAEYDLVFTQTGDHDVQWRGLESTGFVARRYHGALMRPLTSIGADDSGGAGYQLVTLAGNHGLATDNDSLNFFFEGTSAYGSSTGFAVSGASGATFNIPNTGLGAESPSDAYAFGDSTLVGIFNPQGGGYQKWHSTDSSATDRKCHIPSAGAWKFRLYQQDYATVIDRLCFTPSSPGYDPNVAEHQETDLALLYKRYTADDYFGPEESTLVASGDPTDNPQNTVIIPQPGPVTTVDPTSVIPTASQTNVTTTTDVVATFSGMTQLVVNSFTLTTGGNSVSTSSPIITNGNTATITPVQPLNNTVTYTVTLTGSINDNGTAKSISYSWTFTTISATAGSTIMYIDMSRGDFAAGSQLTSDNINTIWNPPTVRGPAANDTYMADDPASSGRGKCLRVHKSVNTAGHTYQIQWHIVSSTYEELYFCQDLYFPVGFPWPASLHISGMFSSLDDIIQAGVPADNPDWRYRFVQAMQQISSGPLYWNRPNGSIALYYYNQNTRDMWFGNYIDPVNRASGASNQAGAATIIEGQWNRIETRWLLNTVGSADGLVQMWHNGQLILNKAVGPGAGGPYRVNASNKINIIKSGTWVGGQASDPNFWMPYSGNWYEDNHILSTSKIT